MLRVRSSERTWLHSRSASKFSERERDDQQVVVALGGVEQRVVRIGLDVDRLLAAEHLRRCARKPTTRSSTIRTRPRRPASAIASFSASWMPISFEVSARMRSSSVIIFSRASERTRAISATSDTGLVRKSSAPASSPLHPVGRMVERRHHDHRECGASSDCS